MEGLSWYSGNPKRNLRSIIILILNRGDNMEKPEGVTILQITAASSSTARGHGVSQVFGLGDDQKIYYWQRETHIWTLFVS